MDLHNLRLWEKAPVTPMEQVLENHYGKLQKWALVLTRGDVGKSEEIVQELCLYLALTKPNLQAVANLDGYFYTCLRNLYQSSLARSAREATRVVSVAEFDSLRFALAGNQGGDTLQRQNELRRICNFAIWRKDQSKSFCYFILHFFHGYFRSEVAAMAGVPLSAIYNKLRTARAEMKAHLKEPGRLRIVTRDTPPEPTLLWQQISTVELFKELRTMILAAGNSECPAEQDLLARYADFVAKPLPCSLLSHLVSCERCLNLVDRHFRRPALESREPLDGAEPRGHTADRDTFTGGMNYASVLRTVRGRLEDIYEHRPTTLSIAVNGRIVAFHDIQGKRSTLAARIEFSEKAQFVEVFSEQDVRFALLPVGEAPPDGPHAVTQHVELSDERWLELNLIFDGLGLNSEVAYYDPVMAIAADEADTAEDEEEFSVAVNPEQDALASGALPQDNRKPLFMNFVHWLHTSIIPSSAMTWALALMVLICVAGHWSYRHTHSPMDAKQVLNQSIKLETAALQGQTEHQVLQLQKISATGSVLQLGSVDVLKDGNGNRYIRRLYDLHHHLVAAEWRVRSTTHSAHAHDELALFSGVPWDRDISVRAFEKLASREPELRTTSDGYELTVAGPTQEQPQLVSATLALNRRLLLVREVLRLHGQEGVYEVRFVQTSYSYSPSRSVPDTTFEPEDGLLSSGRHQQSFLHQALPDSTELAELEIAALYQLNQMDADTGEPIEVLRTADGHVRIFGAIAGDARKRELVSRLDALPNHRLLDIRITSQDGTGNKKLTSLRKLPGAPVVYEVGATKPFADPLVRGFFKQQGLSGKGLDSAVAQFSSNELTLAQHALQNAYALDRLGSALSDVTPGALSRSSQEEWARMVEEHSALLETQMHSLNSQLSGILPVRDRKSNVSKMSETIDSAAQFAYSAKHLLVQVQSVNHDINLAFASGVMQEKGEDAESLLESAVAMLPMRTSAEIADAARHLSGSGKTAPQEYSQKSAKPVTQ